MIIKANIAGIRTKVDCDNKRLNKNLEAYRYDYRGEPDITVKVTDLELMNFCDKYRGFDRDAAVFRLSAENFFAALPEFSGFGIKAANVTVGGQSFVVAGESEESKTSYYMGLLSCGTGVKINDDSYSAIRFLDEGVFVYGTPWSGKNHSNQKEVLSGILIPSDVSSVRKAERKEILERMINCLTLPKRAEQLGAVLAVVDGIEQKVPVLAVPSKDPFAFYSYVQSGFSG